MIGKFIYGMGGLISAVGLLMINGCDLSTKGKRCRFKCTGLGWTKVEWVGSIRGYGGCDFGR